MRLVELNRELDKATDRMLRAPDDVAELLVPKISAMKQERDSVQQQTEQAERNSRPRDIRQEAKAAAQHLQSLDQELTTAAPARVRELLRRMVDQVQLWFDHVQRGKRIECPFTHGVIVLRHDPIWSGLVSRGDRTPIELFIAGVRGWEAGIRRHFPGKSGT